MFKIHVSKNFQITKESTVPTPLGNSDIQRRFDGFRKTPLLWKGMLNGMAIYTKEKLRIRDYPKIDPGSHIRLGKLTEQFVLFELEQTPSLQLLQSNIQIFRDQITIGELDCLIKTPDTFLHLEIVYKFYLYDPAIPVELNRWIGPNRKDSLVQKLDKLKQKQLPLLHHPETVKILDKLNLRPTDFQQKLCFQTQLFVPLNYQISSIDIINIDCIRGCYLRIEDLIHFSDHTFYIPPKLDWLVEPHTDVNWLLIQDFQAIISESLAKQRSPLCWMRRPKGKLQKFFMVWWD